MIDPIRAARDLALQCRLWLGAEGERGSLARQDLQAKGPALVQVLLDKLELSEKLSKAKSKELGELSEKLSEAEQSLVP